jgi:hypothetical protein
MRKQIFSAIVWSDKTEAFGIVKPLDLTFCHKTVFLIGADHTSAKSKSPA